MANKLTEISIKDIIAKNPVFIVTAIAWMFTVWLAYYLSPFVSNLDKQDARIANVEAKVDDLETNGSVQAQLTASDVITIKSDLTEIKAGIKELNATFTRHLEKGGN